MVFAVDFSQLRPGDVGVDLRGGNAFVPQHFLNIPQACAVGQ